MSKPTSFDPVKNAEALPGRITKLTGITFEELYSKESITRRKLKKLLTKSMDDSSLGGTPVFAIAHFANFEKKFLDELFGSNGFPLPLVCTHAIAKKIFPSLPSKGLRGVAGFLEWSGEQGNAVDGAYLKRARAHVDATCWVWKKVCGQLSNRQGVTSYELLSEWLNTKTPAGKRKREYAIDRMKRLSLPSKPGIYRMLNSHGQIIYIGKATSLHSRVINSFSK